MYCMLLWLLWFHWESNLSDSQMPFKTEFQNSEFSELPSPWLPGDELLCVPTRYLSPSSPSLMWAQMILHTVITYWVLGSPRCCVEDFICGLSLCHLNTLHHKKCSVASNQGSKSASYAQPALENLSPPADRHKYRDQQTDNPRVRDCWTLSP